jgi:hypothetical protein
VDDRAALRTSQQSILDRNPLELLVGHGGPLDGAKTAAKYGMSDPLFASALP